MTNYYTVDIEIDADIPTDVLAEHIGQALKHFLKEPTPQPRAKVSVNRAGGVIPDRKYSFTEPGSGYIIPKSRLPRNGRTHPFEGPEVFDDQITIETSEDVVKKVFDAIRQDFPYLRELFDAKREEHAVRRGADIQQPLDEGEWELPGEDRIGED